MRIGPEQRFRVTFDDGRWEESRARRRRGPAAVLDGKPYRERLDAARAATGTFGRHGDRRGTIRGVPAVALVQDFAFMGGSLGVAAGEAFIAAARAAAA
jgi:acetyl-CoA carboxylase carboxyl transferase subunit beta